MLIRVRQPLSQMPIIKYSTISTCLTVDTVDTLVSRQGGVRQMIKDEERKSVHYRLPLFTRKRLRKLAEKRSTSMTGVLVELIERAKL